MKPRLILENLCRQAMSRKESIVVKNLIKVLAKNRPIILTAVGIGGMAVTALLAYKSYPAVTDAIADKADEVYQEENRENLTKMETVKVYAKVLWPTVTLGVVSGVMIVLGHKDQVKRTSAIATAYALSESTLKEYQEKVIEEIGEKKEQAIRDKVAAAKMEKIEPTKETIVVTDDNKPWMCDTATGTYFRMNYERFKRIIAEANLLMFKRDFLSVPDLYELLEVELPPDVMSEFALLGWNSNDGDIEIYTTSALRTICGETVPCMVIEYRARPKFNYNVYGH